jgi:hypothetical protein
MMRRSPIIRFKQFGSCVVARDADARERAIDIVDESFGETCSFVLVPPRGILEIGLGEWPNDEPTHHPPERRRKRTSSFSVGC